MRPKAATYGDYAVLAGESRIVEWAGGEVVEHLPPTTRHQRLVQFVLLVLTLFAERFDHGEVFAGPLAMRLGPRGPVREPDVFFVAKEHADRVQPDGLEGPADLVIEVVSDDSVTRDRAEKFYEYQGTCLLNRVAALREAAREGARGGSGGHDGGWGRTIERASAKSTQ